MNPPVLSQRSYSVSLRRPTPAGVELHILAEVEELFEDRAKIKMTLTAEDKVCATGSGLFVAVKRAILLIIGGLEWSNQVMLNWGN